ncbi:single-stranded-DNA-specific exonuclease RecJ [Paenibacillus sp. MSJ-34]|uniref:single-stranded-DNA-specific exonuclease RecJ n=1 Tax=Paenibacillus sp. MSJ-34 TaxID=2841529 RepID=UPI001C10C5C0|nr:single-stranded-DNA-specific exonuclease RecJ [Paenibacillus sp. MSJ-34]MBU5442639.1 single-stranded-DNA-specific exonuclease RecJ [Paenibacillus sp. MSJ-34]
MLHSQMKWVCAKTETDNAERLAQETGISVFLARLLAARGIENAEQADLFLHGSLDRLHDPFLLQGMREAVERIRRALAHREKIRIYGDYDADGVSSTSLMIGLLRQLGADFDYYIPHRALEGYGLNNDAVYDAKQSGVGLIVTVDTGISAAEQIDYANSLGIDVVVTDHHEPPDVLPNAYALVNPKIPGCPYPFKGLAGVGVAFKLAHAMLGRIPAEYLELATIGTIADLMPLTDENRIIVRFGIERMRRSEIAGIRALFAVAGIELSGVTSTNVAFAMAPRINASGRLEHANIAVNLLTTADEQEASGLALELDQLNKERQHMVETIVKEAEEQLYHKSQGGEPPLVVVLAAEGWNAGVIGIVASKILEKHYRPTFVLSIDPETGLCKGSARSIPGFDLYEALTECADLMEHFGGHQAAAGMTIHSGKLEELERKLIGLAGRKLAQDDLMPSAEIDLEFELADITIEMIEEIETLAPFGMANPSPRFALRNVRVQERKLLGKEKRHLKLTLADRGRKLDAIAFGRSDISSLISGNALGDVLGELQVNEWNGVRKPQLMLQDMCVTHPQVYDFRGSADPFQRALELMECERKANRRPVSNEGAFAILLADASRMPQQMQLHMAGCSLWVYDHKDGAVPANELAAQLAGDRPRSLFIMELPSSLAAMDAALRRLRGIERCYVLYGSGKEAAGNKPFPVSERLSAPSREQFKQVYIQLRARRSWERSEKGFWQQLSKRTGLSERTLDGIMQVFEELAFIQEQNGTYSIVSEPRKADLTSAATYKELVERAELENELVHPATERLTAWFMSRIHDGGALS